MVVVQQDRAVRRHQHVSGEINTQRQQNLSLQVQRATLLRSHSSVYLSWKTSSSVSSLLFFWTVWTVSTVWPRILAVRPPSELGVWIPRSHRTFWDLVPQTKADQNQKPASVAAGLCAAKFCVCFFETHFMAAVDWKKIAGLTLGTDWGLERERMRHISMLHHQNVLLFFHPPTDDRSIQENTLKDPL